MSVMRSRRYSAYRQSGEWPTFLSQLLCPGLPNFHGTLCPHVGRRGLAPSAAASNTSYVSWMFRGEIASEVRWAYPMVGVRVRPTLPPLTQTVVILSVALAVV